MRWQRTNWQWGEIRKADLEWMVAVPGGAHLPRGESPATLLIRWEIKLLCEVPAQQAAVRWETQP